MGAKISVALMLAIHLLAAALLPRLELDNAPELYFPADTPAARLDAELRAQFPGDETLVGFFVGDDLYATPFLEAFERLTRRIERAPHVDRVFSVLRLDHARATPEGFAIEPLIDAGRLAETSAQERRARVLADRFAPGWLAGRDGDSLALIARTAGMTHSRQRVGLEREFHESVRAEGLETRLAAVTGLVPLDTAEVRSIVRDTVLFTPLIAAIGLGLLWWIVGRPAPVLIGAAAISTVVLAALVLVAATGQPYTLVMAMVPTLLAAYAAANLLHLYSALERLGNAGLCNPERVRAGVAEVHRPAVFIVLSTMAGLLSLLLVPVGPIRMFGVVGAFGTMAIYGVVFHLVPPMLLAWDSGNRPGARRGFTWARRVSSRFAGFGVRHAGWVIVTLAGLCVATAPLILAVKVESDLLEYFDASHPLSRATRLVESRLAGVAALEVVADGPARDAFKDAGRLRSLASAQAWIAALPQVDRTVSMVDILEEMHRAFRGGRTTERGLPADNASIAQLLLLYDGRDLAELVDPDYRRARILVNVNVHGANALQRVIEAIEEHLAAQGDTGLRWRIAGSGRLFADFEDGLVDGQLASFLGAFLQIYLLLAVLLRSVAAASIAMVPNLAPLFFVFVVMGAAAIPLDIATVLIASVVLGITVDDTIHFLNSYQVRIRKGFGVVFSVVRSFRASGRAVVAISLLLVAQFALLAASNFRPTAHYGLLAATGLLAGQLVELLMLPALIVLWGRVRR